MLVALPIAGGILLLALLIFAMSRRQDREKAVGLLDRDARKRDRNKAATGPTASAAAIEPTGREIERAAALQRKGGGTSVALAPAPSRAPMPTLPAYIDDEALGVTRRQFLNRSILGLFVLSLAGFGGSVLAFLWPTLSGGFGSKVNAGKLDDILAAIREKKQPFYVPDARSYLNPYPVEDVPKAKAAGYADPIVAGMGEGLVALYQKCVHLGCRVPWCISSQWFECPCHGSQYNRVGEKKGGPAPRGLDRFAVTVTNGVITIDTKTVFQGPPIGTNSTGQEAEGPHCR